MDYLHHVRRGIDYIEARLDSDIDLADVARHAGMSQWHFQRIFKALTNETLKTYVRSRRFANALDKLAHGRERILEIALASGFESQEAFTRAFKKAFAISPASYRKSHQQIPFLRKVRFDDEYLLHLHGGVSLEPTIHVQPARSMVGVRTRGFGVDSEKNNFAGKLNALWGGFLPRMPQIASARPGTAYGIVRPISEHDEELEYVAAVEVNAADSLPDEMVRVDVPETRYATFMHRGPLQRLDQTVNYIYSSWLSRSGLRHTYGADIEVYGPEYRHESEDCVMFYSIPVSE
ncbi:MAG: helix-turn-helix domain-containing protein [Proteobacteria bacterium]|nr:MAG: helix-turn-helix domain-containing protein [Pseudomonadota bacterium]